MFFFRVGSFIPPARSPKWNPGPSQFPQPTPTRGAGRCLSTLGWPVLAAAGLTNQKFSIAPYALGAVCMQYAAYAACPRPATPRLAWRGSKFGPTTMKFSTADLTILRIRCQKCGQHTEKLVTLLVHKDSMQCSSCGARISLGTPTNRILIAETATSCARVGEALLKGLSLV